MAKPFFVFNTVDTVFDNSGLLVSSGAQVFTYQAGTSTPLTTYPTLTDATNLTNPNPNPVLADSAGRIPAIWATQACKIIVAPSNDTNPPSNPYRTRDNITGLGQVVTMKTITTNYTAVAADRDMLIEVDASGGGFTVNLLAASIAGMGFNVKYKKIDSSSNTITITPNGTDQIDKVNSSLTLSVQNDYFEAYCDGTQWLIPTHNIFTTASLVNLTVSGTFTYNSSSGGTSVAGPIFINNGTTWIPSTATYPITATSTNTVLYSDGTNWNPSSYTFPATLAQGDVLYASSSGVLTNLPKSVTPGQWAFLANTGVSSNPNWSTLDFTVLLGNIGIYQFNSGTNASATTFFRGDNTWSPPITMVRQIFTTSGTYTPTTGMLYAMAEAVGGGGGGGGSATTGASTISVSGGGGGGGYSSKLFSAATIGSGQSVTIGAGGTAGAGGASPGAGGTGGTTTFGSSLLTAVGGTGGNYIAATSGIAVLCTAGGAGGTASHGTVNLPGNPGTFGTQALLANAAGGCGGTGGSGYLGQGAGAGGSFAAGGAGGGYGAGGGGSSMPESQTGLAGGVGSAGLIVITEYCA